MTSTFSYLTNVEFGLGALFAMRIDDHVTVGARRRPRLGSVSPHPIPKRSIAAADYAPSSIP